MDYESISQYLLETFYLTDFERTWLESRFTITEDDESIWYKILRKYHLIK